MHAVSLALDALIDLYLHAQRVDQRTAQRVDQRARSAC